MQGVAATGGGNDQKIAPLRQCVQRVKVLMCRTRHGAAIVVANGHVKTCSTFSHCAADAAHAQDAQSLATDARTQWKTLLAPLTGAHKTIGPCHITCDIEHERKC